MVPSIFTRSDIQIDEARARAIDATLGMRASIGRAPYVRVCGNGRNAWLRAYCMRQEMIDPRSQQRAIETHPSSASIASGHAIFVKKKRN